jgi:predicted outer membrane repeat protein
MKAPLNVRLIALAFSAALISVSAPLPAYANGGDSSLNTWVARGAADEDNGADFGTSCADPDYIADGSADNVQLQAAIEHTLTGGTVHICPGTYTFASILEPSQAALMLVGESGGTVTLNGNGIPILRASDTDLTLESLTLENAVSNQVGGAVRAKSLGATSVSFINNVCGAGGGAGGGIYSFGDVTLDRTVFRGNSADSGPGSQGGAVHALGDLEITDSDFVNNSAYGYGGAVYVVGDTVVSESSFSGNTADDGGAIYMVYDALWAESSFTITDTSFSGNRADFYGGALFVDVYLLNISGSTFKGNSAGEHDGGAIYSDDGEVVVNQSTFVANVAGGNGGAISSDTVGIQVASSTFSSNRAVSGWGGALFSYETVDSTGSKYLRNRADYGGAMYIGLPLMGTTDLAKNRFSRNRAGTGGGALAFNTDCYTLPRPMVRSVLRRNRFDANAGRRTPEIYEGQMIDMFC